MSRIGLDSSNFRTAAQKVVEKYEQKGMMVDALLWSSILREYEIALNQAAAGFATIAINCDQPAIRQLANDNFHAAKKGTTK